MQNQIETLIENIKTDYYNWTSRGGTKELTEVNENMIAAFNNGLEVREGNKYIKIVTNNSVWGFVVKGDNDKKFQKGDILKAAGFATPARNHARGNVFATDYAINWTGPLYMMHMG